MIADSQCQEIFIALFYFLLDLEDTFSCHIHYQEVCAVSKKHKTKGDKNSFGGGVDESCLKGLSKGEM